LRVCLICVMIGSRALYVADLFQHWMEHLFDARHILYPWSVNLFLTRDWICLNTVPYNTVHHWEQIGSEAHPVTYALANGNRLLGCASDVCHQSSAKVRRRATVPALPLCLPVWGLFEKIYTFITVTQCLEFKSSFCV
jgi:hypothetical protein